MKLRRVLAFLTITAMVLAFSAACAKATEPQSTPQAPAAQEPAQEPAPAVQPVETPAKIAFYGGWTGPDMDKMKALVDKFNQEQNKIQVEFTSLQWTPMYAKFLTDYKSDNPPDVLAMHTFVIGQFADMGVLDAKAVEGLGMNKADYLDAAWNASFYKNAQYAVPLSVNMHGLYYNTEMFSKAGIQAPPKTGEELISIGQKLTVDKNGKNPNETGFDANNITQYGLGFAQNHHTFYQFYALMNQQSSNSFTDSMTKIELDEEKAAKAFGFLQDLIFKHKITPKGIKSAIDDFKAGNIAMIIDGNWQLAGLESSNVKWATSTYPKVFDKQANWGASETLTFPLNEKADASKKQAASEFVKWLANNTADWAKSGQLPANKAALEAAKSLPGREAFFAELDTTIFLPAHPKATIIFSSAAPSPILTAAHDAVLNNKNPLEIAKQLKKDIDSVLAQ